MKTARVFVVTHYESPAILFPLQTLGGACLVHSKQTQVTVDFRQPRPWCDGRADDSTKLLQRMGHEVFDQQLHRAERRASIINLVLPIFSLTDLEACKLAPRGAHSQVHPAHLAIHKKVPPPNFRVCGEDLLDLTPIQPRVVAEVELEKARVHRHQLFAGVLAEDNIATFAHVQGPQHKGITRLPLCEVPTHGR